MADEQLPEYVYRNGQIMRLQPRNRWVMRPKTVYRYNKTTRRVEQVPTGEVEYDEASVYQPATSEEIYQLGTAANTRAMSTYVPPAERGFAPRGSRTRYPTRAFGLTGAGAGYPGQYFGPGSTAVDENGQPIRQPVAGTRASNRMLGVPASPTDYWGVAGNPTPRYFQKDPNNPLSKLGGGYFVQDESGGWTRLPNYSPRLAATMRGRLASGGGGGGGGGGSAGTGGIGEGGLTPEEAAAIEDAIGNMEYGRGSYWTGRMGKLALESAEHPGMTDAEREAAMKRLTAEEIVPGFASERFAVASAGGPGARQRLGELRVAETGARMKLASGLAEEQLQSQRQERQQALGTLGSAAEIERAYGGDVISSMLRYGTTPGHGTAELAGPRVGAGVTYLNRPVESVGSTRLPTRRTRVRRSGIPRRYLMETTGGRRPPSLLAR